MRHGCNSEIKIESKHDQGVIKQIPGNELGCYFCNDITAPGNVSNYILIKTKYMFLNFSL